MQSTPAAPAPRRPRRQDAEFRSWVTAHPGIVAVLVLGAVELGLLAGLLW